MFINNKDIISIKENKLADNFGIDLINRKMWYKPWLIDNNGKYIHPSENDIEEIYGISGEAVNETLLYFEKCGGNSQELIQLLNEHVIDDCFYIDRETLLDKNRWYTNEYYFYFIMFTKKLMGDYNWRFTKGDNVQLSKYHKLYEMGFLRYIPYGSTEKDDTNALPNAIIKCYTKQGYDFSDFFNWAETLVKEKTSVSYKDVVSKLDNYWICSEFTNFLYQFAKIILNKNNMVAITNESFEYFDLTGFSYVPESLLLMVQQFISNKGTNFFTINVKYNKNKGTDFTFKISDVYNKKKDDIYQISIFLEAYSIVIAAFPQIIKKILRLNKLPKVINLSGWGTANLSFTLKWEKRILSIPYLQLFICNLFFFILLIINNFLNWKIMLPMLFIVLPVNFIIIQFRKSKIQKNKIKILEDDVIETIEENKKRLEKSEELSSELIIEKQSLEQKVKERTFELAEANERLKEMDIVKTNFFINLAHETKTPLTLIGNYLDKYIKKNSKSDELEIIKINIDKLTADMVNFLDAQKLEKGQIFYNHSLISNISEILNSQVILFQETAISKNIKINKKISDNLFVKADPYAIGRIINNLIYNAIKYNKTNGTIDVILESSGKIIKFIVKDSGIGISKDHLETIFESYHQISHEKRNIQGIGMGLYITKNIIESIGGKIEVESELDKGSVFKVVFNNYRLQDNERPEVINDYLKAVKDVNIKLGKEEFREDRKNILLLEDNIQMLSYLHESLKENYNVFYASNGKEALEKFKIIPKPNIIISDIMMDIMDGYEFHEEIIKDKKNKDIPFLFLTAISSKEEKLKGLEKGAIDFISKPFLIEELIAKIKSIVKNQEDQKRSNLEKIERKIMMLLENEESIKNVYTNLEQKCKQYNISDREIEVLKYIVNGKENKEIGDILKISTNTVKRHVQNIYLKFGVQNKVELINLIYNKH